MTKKDFIALAEALNAAKPFGIKHAARAKAAHEAWENCCHRIANACAASNGRFDRNRFLAACGMED